MAMRPDVAGARRYRGRTAVTPLRFIGCFPESFRDGRSWLVFSGGAIGLGCLKIPVGAHGIANGIDPRLDFSGIVQRDRLGVDFDENMAQRPGS